MRIFFLTFIISLTANSAELSLEQYLKQVEENNQQLNASKITSAATVLRKDEQKLIFTPSVFAQAQTFTDKKSTTSVAMQGDKTENTMAQAGLMQQFNFGLKGKLSYTLSHTAISNAIALPLSNYQEASLGVELSQPLWRNMWGSESKAQAELIERQNEIQKHTENFKVITLLSKAEAVYWGLSQIRKVVQVQKESLERANKIKSWAQHRLSTGLAENSDFLQADANVKFREYELKSSIQDEKSLQRTFNSIRGMENEQVFESLVPVSENYLNSLVIPVKKDLREDTKIAREVQKLSKASADLSIERNKPTFEVYGSYILNGRDAARSEAISKGFTQQYSTDVIGVRFNAPIDVFNLQNNISAYKKDQIAAELNFKQKLFDETQEWNDLSIKFEDTKAKIQLAKQIEAAQKIKATNERDRLSKGRTVTFQVLNFEQDYAQSELLKIKSETDLLNIYAQLKIFAAGDKL